MGSGKKGLFKRGKGHEAPCRVIGITGAGRGTGVTHLSVLAANYLASFLQRKTAFIEWNDHGDISGMGRILSGHAGDIAWTNGYGYRILEVAFHKHGNPQVLAACMDGSYDDIIIDFGEFRPAVRSEWLRCSVKIVTAALCEWKLEAFMELLTKEEGRRAGWIYTAAFGSEDIRKEVERQFRIPLVRIPLSVDAFSVDYRTMQWFERIL